jgi:DHA2 family multidrug resistance protein
MMLDRGENLDWFEATEIMIEAGLAITASYMFIVHTLTAERPFIDPRMFADRNFAVSLIAIFIVGIILLGTLALMTPYLQQLMNYPVLTAGIVLAPRGIGTMVAMMIVGRIIGRVDPRYLFTLGLLLTAFSLWEMTAFTPDVSEWAIIRTGVVQGMGLGFIFVPLSTMAFATLDVAYRTQGAALFSLVRNVGSSIGISFVVFLLTRNTTINHAELAAQVTPFNIGLSLPGLAENWSVATQTGKAMLDSEITRQSSIIAYANDFRLMMYVALLALPLALLLSKPRQGGGASAAAAVAD